MFMNDYSGGGDMDVGMEKYNNPDAGIRMESAPARRKRMADKRVLLREKALRKRMTRLKASGRLQKNTGTFDDTGFKLASSADANMDTLLEKKKYEADLKGKTDVERRLMEKGIAISFDPNQGQTNNLSGGGGQDVKLDLSDMRHFITSPVPRGALVKCYIMRNKKGLKNKIFPTFSLHLEEGQQFLLAARKRKKNRTSNYLLSMDLKKLERESEAYVGKLRSNFVGTSFTVYNRGINPKEVKEEMRSISNTTVRKELGLVQYESNILGSRGPRKMVVLLPKINSDGTCEQFQPFDGKQSLQSQIDAIPASDKENGLPSPLGDRLVILKNKEPTWNDQVGAYVLNFHGRVSIASVKNFQLVADHDAETVLLQFGRVAEDRFTMDIRWPLSPRQAFSICLSSFDYKLACE